MEAISNSIVQTFEGYRMKPTDKDQYESVGRALLVDKVNSFVTANKPVEFYMLGFPFKSSNTRDKVLGVEPDFAEQATLENFAAFNSDIKKVYSPGVNITMARDGQVFNDLLGIDDKTVERYGEISKSLQGLAPVEWLNLDDFYRGVDRREKLIKDFGITPEQLEKEILFNDDVNFLYRGMSIFMREELAYKEFSSGNQRQKAAKILAREMMLRNEAYSNLIRHEIGDKIRLSMHPSINNGAKYSFQLIKGDTPYSAWHSALVVDSKGNYSTMHKKDALEAGYELAYKDNKPYNFIKP